MARALVIQSRHNAVKMTKKAIIFNTSYNNASSVPSHQPQKKLRFLHRLFKKERERERSVKDSE